MFLLPFFKNLSCPYISQLYLDTTDKIFICFNLSFIFTVFSLLSGCGALCLFAILIICHCTDVIQDHEITKREPIPCCHCSQCFKSFANGTVDVRLSLSPVSSSPVSPRVAPGHAIDMRVWGRQTWPMSPMSPMSPGWRIKVCRDLTPLNGVIVKVKIVHHVHHIPRDFLPVIQHFLGALILTGPNHLAIRIKLKISQGSIGSRPVFVPH